MRPVRLVPLGVLAIAAAVPAFVLAGVWQFADSNVPVDDGGSGSTSTTLPTEPRPALATSLLSYRRQADALAERVAESQSATMFAREVAAVTDALGPTSCLAVEAHGMPIASASSSLAVIPASNQKLLVAAVALDVLGSDFRFRTELWSPLPTDGVVPGDVSIIGGGDPVLQTDARSDNSRYPAFNTTSLDTLADQLVRIGIRRIDGDIVGDGSRYDDEYRAPSWGPEITNGDAGPYDALLVDDGIIENGNYGLVPARSAAVVFTELVRARGIEVVGGAANEDRVVDPSFTALAVIESRPLPDIVAELLYTSDNNTAEMLVKEIGYQATGDGSRPAGLEVIRSRLTEWGLPLDGLSLADGSGLSRENRVSCETLAAVVTEAPVASELVGLLPVAGRDGTLAEQLLGTPAEGFLRAKTGTLSDVKALTGTQPAGDDSNVTFSLVLNGPGVHDATTYLPIWTELVDLISRYPIVVEPDPDALAPR